MSDSDRNRVGGGPADLVSPAGTGPTGNATPASPLDFLNELDVPTALGAARAAEPTERKRSTLEFLNELDVPARPSSHDTGLSGEALTPENAPGSSPEPSPRSGPAIDPADTPTSTDAPRPPPTSAAANTSPGSTGNADTQPGDQAASDAVNDRFSWEDEAAPTGAGGANEARPRFSWEPPEGTDGAAPDPAGPRFSWQTERTSDGRLTPEAIVREVIAQEAARPRIELGPRVAPKPVEETIEERRQRLAVRVHTCRDAFRLLGFLGISDDARHGTARLLLTLEERLAAGASRADKHDALKSPEPFLVDATREKLNRIERVVVEVEDKLLALDDLVSAATFRGRVEGRDHSRTVLARYARLLASRHFPAGQRRDRFEWLAVQLLTTRGTDGRRVMIPKDRARVVLQHLIGGMPDRALPDEAAVQHLQETIAKFDELQSAQEFFDSGFYLDAHGYKVSMRDQLLHPDFLYLSVEFSAAVENRLEEWIGQFDAAHVPGQLAPVSETREGIRRLLEEQERAVDQIFGAMQTAPGKTGPAGTDAPERRPPPRRTTPEPKTETLAETIAARLPVHVEMSRETAVFAGLAAVILVVFGWVLSTTGAVTISEETWTPLTTPELQAYCPILISGYLVTDGSDRKLDASVSDQVWAKLAANARMEAANTLARSLRNASIPEANVRTHRARVPVVEIKGGNVLRVATQ
jgi:hypothetical protein